VPALANVWLNVAPVASVALLNEPSSAVTVWPALSLLVHVTVVPTATVTAAGWKLKSAIDTAVPLAADAAADAAAADGTDDGAADDAGACVELPEQAAIMSIAVKTKAASRAWRMLVPPKILRCCHPLWLSDAATAPTASGGLA
jgi:hypothetical protein